MLCLVRFGAVHVPWQDIGCVIRRTEGKRRKVRSQDNRKARLYQTMQIGSRKGRAQHTIHRACQQHEDDGWRGRSFKGTSTPFSDAAAVRDTALVPLLLCCWC